MLLVTVLCFSDVSVAKAEEELTDNQKAIAIIDGFIKEMEELGYENFNEDVINTELTDSYLWAARLRNVKKQIIINDSSLDRMYLDQYIMGEIEPYYYDIQDIYRRKSNYYYFYYSQLLLIEELLQGNTSISLSDMISKGKELKDNYNTLENYMWLREVNYLLNYNFKGNLYQDASKTYIWYTLQNNARECINQVKELYVDGIEVLKYTTKSERLDDFIKCLELLNEELDNPFIDKMTINVSVEKTAYDKYVEQQKGKTTNSKTDTNKTSNTLTKKSVSVAGKKVSKLKLVAKKGKIKVAFAKLQNATSYEIQISTNKKYKKAKTYTVKKTSKTFKKLKRKKVYYVRVRAVSGNTKGKWVKKKIKTK